ncbi:MAG: alpha/beta fold hydrolase [Chloroflexota bacterium]
MATAAVNGIELYYEEEGQGTPLVFSHEFAGDYRSWEPQMRFFSRFYRCITYSHRGYRPSSVPATLDDYSEEHAVEDLFGLVSTVAGGSAHVVGLSMGGSAALKLGLRHPEVCRSLVIAGAGSGATIPDRFPAECQVVASAIEREGMAQFSRMYSRGPGRQRFMHKDRRGFDEFVRMLGEHSDVGSAMTQRGVQARRTSILQIQDQLPSIDIPTLIIVGDEDTLCIEPSLVMKRLMPNAGMTMFSKSGHTLNLEEPALFNRTVLDFLIAVEQGRWSPRQETAESLLPSDVRPT